MDALKGGVYVFLGEMLEKVKCFASFNDENTRLSSLQSSMPVAMAFANVLLIGHVCVWFLD